MEKEHLKSINFAGTSKALGPANLRIGVCLHMVRVSSKEPRNTMINHGNTIRNLSITISSLITCLDSELPCANTLTKLGNVHMRIDAAMPISEAN